MQQGPEERLDDTFQMISLSTITFRQGCCLKADVHVVTRFQKPEGACVKGTVSLERQICKKWHIIQISENAVF